MLAYSIVIPTKDRPQLLCRAVASALASDAPRGEVLVIDDHSKIPARDVLSEIDDPRLRICETPAGRTGVSATRNAGFAQALGNVVFFLDDDDELLPDYCGHVLTSGAPLNDYGFSSYLHGSVALGKPARPARVRFAEGPIPRDAPLRKQLCGFGMGFWIWRHVALQMGPVASDLAINEDTEYVCRLITAGKRGWYSATPGVIVHSHAVGPSDVHHITKRTSAVERARCMRVLCDRFPHMVGHLGSGYIRHCLKTGATAEAWSFVQSQPDWRIRNHLKVVLATKLLAYGVSRRLDR